MEWVPLDYEHVDGFSRQPLVMVRVVDINLGSGLLCLPDLYATDQRFLRNVLKCKNLVCNVE